MLKLDSILQIMNQIVKNKKVIGLMKDELSGKTIKELVGLTANNLYLFNR